MNLSALNQDSMRKDINSAWDSTLGGKALNKVKKKKKDHPLGKVGGSILSAAGAAIGV